MTIDGSGQITGDIRVVDPGVGTLSGTLTGDVSSWVADGSDCSSVVASYTFSSSAGSGSFVGTVISVDQATNTLTMSQQPFTATVLSATGNGSASGTAETEPTLTFVPNPPPAIPSTPQPVAYTVTLSSPGPAYPPPTLADVGISASDGTTTCAPAWGSTSPPGTVPASASASCVLDEGGPGSVTPAGNYQISYRITAAYPGNQYYLPASTAITIGTGFVTNGNGPAYYDATNLISEAYKVVGTGGGATDTVTGVAYGGNSPGSTLRDASDYFDVAVTSGLQAVTIGDCNEGVSSNVLEWLDPMTAVWSPVSPVPVYDGYCLDVTLSSTSSPPISSLTHTVFGDVPGDLVTSPLSETATSGKPFSMPVVFHSAHGGTPTLKLIGRLPRGVHFVDNHNGTGTFSGTASASSAGVYKPVIQATVGTGSTAVVTTQTLCIFVLQAPSIRESAIKRAFIGRTYLFTFKTKGYPAPSLSLSGTLPNGLRFTDHHNGTASVGGVPAAGSAGTYQISVTAANGAGSVTKGYGLVVR